MKLKTLEDFEPAFNTGLSPASCHAFKELRQEAINRWKFFKKKYMSEKDEKKRIHYYGRMEEIKDFNNLISGDLKWVN